MTVVKFVHVLVFKIYALFTQFLSKTTVTKKVSESVNKNVRQEFVKGMTTLINKERFEGFLPLICINLIWLN